MSTRIFSFLFFALVPFLAHAQALPGTGTVALTALPQFPKPYETIRLEVSSFSVDIDRATIVWYIDDEEIRRGIGERVLETTVGAAGDATRVEVFVTPISGSRMTRTAILRPAGVDILWHAHAYTPPFYRGKALPTSRSFIVFTAVPELISTRGVAADPNTVVYTWQQAGITLGSASGYGNRRVVLRGETLPQQAVNVSVIAESFDGALRAQDVTNVYTARPAVIMYEKHPLEGIRYEQALVEEYELQKDEFTVRAEAFFFSLNDIADNLLRYEWSVSDTDFETPDEKKNEVTLRREEETGGSVPISLTISNAGFDRILQKAAATLHIILESNARF